jgi:Methyltransferase domain
MTRLSFPIRVLLALTTEPTEIWTGLTERVLERAHERRERLRRPQPTCRYEPVADWDRLVHEHLGVSWPCRDCAEFGRLWSEIVQSITATGVRVGPMSFDQWNDGDAGFVRAVWSLTRHLRAERIVETGVAHGFTSRFILEALRSNGAGHLWSIDLPPLDPALRRQVGIAVTDDLSDRWTYVRGSSRRHLPALLAQLEQIDLFIHDSLHTERNVRFELDLAWKKLRPGGALVIDDIDANWGFHSFNETFSGHPHFVCEAEPISPDNRRFNQKGLFGIVLKLPSDIQSRIALVN